MFPLGSGGSDLLGCGIGLLSFLTVGAIILIRVSHFLHEFIGRERRDID